jgi:hypothetical protein
MSPATFLANHHLRHYIQEASLKSSELSVSYNALAPTGRADEKRKIPIIQSRPTSSNH